MHRKILRSLALILFAASLAFCANDGPLSASALTSTVRKSTETIVTRDELGRIISITTNHYLYYGNGALRSVNNYVGSTYNFSQSEFEEMTDGYSDNLLGEVNYDDTGTVWVEAPSDNLSALTKIMKMPSQKIRWLTNYTTKDLKNKNLIKSDGTLNESIADENIVSTAEATTSDLVSYMSYLISKDYYTIPKSLSIDTTPALYTSVKESDIAAGEAKDWFYAIGSDGTSNNFKKSDLIMVLSKAFCGVQNSSALVMHSGSVRDGVKWSVAKLETPIKYGSGYSVNPLGGSGMDYYGKSYNTYSDIESGYDHHGVQFVGDYWVYYNPNVYELYLSEALNDGIITLSDLSTSNPFRSQYKNKSTGNWGNGNLLVDSSITAGCLGNSHNVNYMGGKLYVSPKAPDYFGEKENMTMMEALKIIEAYMRANDENMSKTEEKIVQYKLGLNLLSYLDDEDRSTVTYLLAKGVLDGSDTSISSILYGDATVARVLPVLYRAVNKEARTDFSVIQLTDSETFWANEDFSASSFSIFEPDDDIIHETIEVVKGNPVTDNEKDTSYLPESKHPSLLGKMFGEELTVNAASGVSLYTVTKYFDTKSVYKIGSMTVSQLYSNGVPTDEVNTERTNLGISSMDYKEDYEYKGKKHKVYIVNFTLSATSKEAAISAVDKKITLLSEIDKYKKALNGVAQVTDASMATTCLVSQSSLKQSFSNITVLEDKILMNTVTGTLAYFSYDKKMALVGSQIITSDYDCIVKTGNEVYYNLDSIITLLSSAYIDVIGPQMSIVVDDIECTKTIKLGTEFTDSDDFLMSAQYVKMYQEETNAEANDNKSGFLCLATDGAKESLKNEDKEVSFFIKLNTLSSASNMLTKSFSVNYGDKEITGTIIVSFQYAVPPVGAFSEWLPTTLVDTDMYTYQEATKIINTPPDQLLKTLEHTEAGESVTSLEESALNDWWYSNYGMANALCNFMYETSGNVYITSGYVCPSVTLLVNNNGKKSFSESIATTTEIRDTIFDQIFSGFALGDDYLKYNGGTQTKFWHNYFQCDASKPDYGSMGFNKNASSVTNVIANVRKFEVFEQSGKTSLKKSKIGKQAIDQQLKTYGIQYAVAASGSVYQRVDTIYGSQDPLFYYTVQTADGEKDSLKELTVRSRTASIPSTFHGLTVYFKGTSFRYLGTSTIPVDHLRYYGICPNKLFNGKSLASTCYQVHLRGVGIDYHAYYKQVAGETETQYDIQSYSFGENCYIPNFAGQINRSELVPSEEWVHAVLFDKAASLLLDPSCLKQDPATLKGIFGSKEIYIYTDAGRTAGVMNGKIYKWDGKVLSQVTQASTLSALVKLDEAGSLKMYSMPVYYLPTDVAFLQKDHQGQIVLDCDIINKALNHLQYDLTSLNNQLIEAYLDEQVGVVKINSVVDGTEVMIGDTVWTKVGDYWQSNPIKDTANVKAIISDHDDLMWYSNTLFSGLYLSVQGRQYAIQGYVEEMKLGSLVGTKSQYKKGVIYGEGNDVKVRKKNKSSVANSKTSATYVSVKCKFSDELLIRPINAEKTAYTYLGQCSTGLISSADYPFFDAEASWESPKSSLYKVNSTVFKPSSAFTQVKNTINSQFRQLLIEDSWNFIWFVIILLASYLLIMSWFAYGVVTKGVAKRGFEVLMMKDGSGGQKGVDLIKFLTFGIYSLDREVSLTRMVVISFACCFIIATVLLIVF